MTFSSLTNPSQRRRPLPSTQSTTQQTQNLSPSQTAQTTPPLFLQHQQRGLEPTRPAEPPRRVTRNPQIPCRLTLTTADSTILPSLHISMPCMPPPPLISMTVPTRLFSMYYKPIVPLPILDPIPSFIQSIPTTTNPGCDAEVLILPRLYKLWPLLYFKLSFMLLKCISNFAGQYSVRFSIKDFKICLKKNL